MALQLKAEATLTENQICFPYGPTQSSRKSSSRGSDSGLLLRHLYTYKKAEHSHTQ